MNRVNNIPLFFKAIILYSHFYTLVFSLVIHIQPSKSYFGSFSVIVNLFDKYFHESITHYCACMQKEATYI